MVYCIWGFKPGSFDEQGKMIEAASKEEALSRSGLDSPYVDIELDMSFEEALRTLL